MRALIVYESMYGNTKKIAEAIADGLLKGGADATVVTAADVSADQTAAADLVVAGGPTHGWSMSRPATRRSAVEVVRKAPGGALQVREGADGTGLREWIAGLAAQHLVKSFAAFDTRRHAPLGLSGSAARAIDRRLRRLGWRSARQPQGFYVTKADQLEPDEEARARGWGSELAGS